MSLLAAIAFISILIYLVLGKEAHRKLLTIEMEVGLEQVSGAYEEEVGVDETSA